MTASKGGHAAKDDDEKSYKKFMIEHDNRSMDYRTISDIETGHVVDAESEDGVSYTIRVLRMIPPFETIFKYPSLSVRDRKLKQLKNKLQMVNTIFV